MRTFVGLILALTSCSSDETTAEGQVRERASMFQRRLQAELQGAMAQGGPVAAVTVCSERAQAIATECSGDGLRVRRVGTRVRNPANTPGEQDQVALDQLAQQPDCDLLSLPAGEDGVARHYLPLRVQPLCLVCHGDAAAMPQALRDVLQQRYPQDAATGYVAGDLRGAVVVESSAR